MSIKLQNLASNSNQGAVTAFPKTGKIYAGHEPEEEEDDLEEEEDDNEDSEDDDEDGDQ